MPRPYIRRNKAPPGPPWVVNIEDHLHDCYVGLHRDKFWHGILLKNQDRGFWGNPFLVGAHGDAQHCKDLHRYWLLYHPDAHEQRRRLPELKGKVLGCHCKRPTEDVPCHADTLHELAETAFINTQVMTLDHPARMLLNYATLSQLSPPMVDTAISKAVTALIQQLKPKDLKVRATLYRNAGVLSSAQIDLLWEQ